MSQFEGLVSDVRRLNEARARRKEAERNNLIYAGEQLVFSTLVDCLHEGHPMRQQAVLDHIAYLGRLAHAEGRTPRSIDPEAILSELQDKHQRAVRRAAEELEDQQPETIGFFRRWHLRIHREPIRLSGVKSLEEAQNVRLRAAQIVRNTPQFKTVDAVAAVRTAMAER